MKRLAAIVCALVFSATAHADTMLIFDGSNSMWGEIDNVAKIEIAREAVNVLLEDWTPSEPLGVVAYGHRQTRSCTDIEVLAQPGSTFGKIRRAVNDVFPKGRTPLTDALLTASRTLFTNQSKNPTLILLTDGVDTCQKDPCDIAARLKSYRSDFRVHVVGFHVKDNARDSLKCLSEKTGGRFFSAQSSETLWKSMIEVAGIVSETSVESGSKPVPAPSAQLQALLGDEVEASPEPPAPIQSIQAPRGGITRSDPMRVLQERSREIVSRSLKASEPGTGANPNTAVFAFGTSKVSFSTRLARDDERTFAFEQPTWTVYDRKGQARGRQLIQSNASLPVFELPVGDYFIVLEAENVRYNYRFSVTDTLPKSHVLTLDLGVLVIDVDNEEILDVFAFRFERGPENPSLDLKIKGPWSQTLLLPQGTYIVQGRMKDRRTTAGPLIVEPGQRTQARILVR